jgi:hypothetical protein
MSLGFLFVIYDIVVVLTGTVGILAYVKEKWFASRVSETIRAGAGKIHQQTTKQLQSASFFADIQRHIPTSNATYFAESAKHKNWQSNCCSGTFTSHVRKEDNFIRCNTDPQLVNPPGSSMEIETTYTKRPVLYTYLFHERFMRVFWCCFGFALISSGYGSFLSLVQEWARKLDQPLLSTFIEANSEKMSSLTSDIKFFPTFLLVGHLAFYVKRWRNFMFAAWRVEGRMKDFAICVGSDVLTPDDPATKRLLYRVYRYLVVAMAFEYKTVHRQLKLKADPVKAFVEMGLLTQKEHDILKPAASRMRDTVLSWLALEVNEGTNKGMLAGRHTLHALQNLTQVRANMMFFHGNNWYPQPNLWAAFMVFTVDVLAGVIIVGFPFRYHSGDVYQCNQPHTGIGVFLTLSIYWGATAIIGMLQHPFASQLDTFDIDALIAGTEQTVFCSLRASFDNRARYAPSSEEKAQALNPSGASEFFSGVTTHLETSVTSSVVTSNV